MSDLRMQLDRVAARAQPGTDAFERLAQRRRRHHRNRRITAGTVALAVATGGALAAYTAFAGHRESQTVRQLANGAVLDPELRFDVAPGVDVPIGHPVTLHASLPRGSFVETGVILRACGDQTAVFVAHRVPGDGNIRSQVSGPRCAGVVTYPIHGWLAAFLPAPQVSSGAYPLTARLLVDLHRTGSLPHLTLVPVRFVSAKSGTHAGPYPRGTFQACPDTAGTIATTGAGAGRVALRFSKLWASGHQAKARSYVDPSARDLSQWAAAGTPKRFRILHSQTARRDGLVWYGCGKQVADRSWEVVIDDGTSSASLDFTIYLVRRSDGWKSWGSY